MELLEYQAKALFSEIGIPILPSQRIDNPRDLKGLKIPYPVVLKSQVRTGGRGKAGGVRFVENTIDAVAAAQTIFHLPIVGEYPDVILAEAKYDAEREFYLAVMLSRSVSRPVLLGSQHGGLRVEAAVDAIQQVVVEYDFSPFYARRLAIKMGLTGTLIETVSDIVEKMFHLFVNYDLDLVEINPLAVSINGGLMALDGKVTVNDDALDRHPHLLNLLSGGHGSPLDIPKRESPFKLKALQPNGQIALVCSGSGLTMATLDLLSQHGGAAACCLTLGRSVPSHVAHVPSPLPLPPQGMATGVSLTAANGTLANGAPANVLAELGTNAIPPTPDLGSAHPASPPLVMAHVVNQLLEHLRLSILDILQSADYCHVTVVLVNILGSVITSQDVVQAIADLCKSNGFKPNGTHPGRATQFVIRWASPHLPTVKTELQAQLGDLPIYLVDDLDEAVTQTIALAHPLTDL